MSYEIDDDKYPASAVALIVSRWGSQYSSGTGFLVGRNDVLTAAHVIYNGALGGLADEIRIYPSYDPDASNNRFFEGVWVEYYEDFDPNSDGFIQIGDFFRPTGAGSELDIALIALDQDLTSRFGYFGIDPNFPGGAVGVIGYPEVYGRQPMFDSGTVRRSSIDNVYLLNSDLEVNPGNSGGPIFYDYGDRAFAVGIVSTKAAATSLEAHSSWLTTSISENDRFLSGYLPVPTYTLASLRTTVNEGETASFTLSTTNVTAFTSLNYRITGVEAEDIQNGRLSGTVVVGQDGKATIAIPIKKDLITEGDETLRIAIENATASVVIKDTSQTISYTNGDRYVGDVINGQLNGDGILAWANGDRFVGNFRDGKLHGQGTLTFANGNKYNGGFLHDKYHGQGTFTFKDGVVWSGEWRNGELLPSLVSLSHLFNAVDEGGTARFALTVTNFKSSEEIRYTITGIQAADVVGGQLTGSVTVDAQGRATISIPIAADNLTEGPETMTVTVRSPQRVDVASANVTINDTSTTRAPEATLRAPAGQSKIAFSQPVSSAVISQDSSGSWTVTLPGGSSNRLEGYKRVEFADKTVALDTEAVGGQAYRVYKAAFNREPDQGGLGYWIAQMDSGMNMVEVAARFIDSNEFRAVYGTSPTDEQYLTKVYQNVLGRDPEPDGYNWWLNEMRTNPEKTRAKVLADFSESAENKVGVSSLISAGVVFQPYLPVANPTYSLTASSVMVDEGATAVFALFTTQVAAGTSFSYLLSGIQAADIVGGRLTGTVTLNAQGQATISIPKAADNLTEGSEVLTAAIRSPQGSTLASSSVVINDTSVTIVGISVSGGGGGGGGAG